MEAPQHMGQRCHFLIFAFWVSYRFPMVVLESMSSKQHYYKFDKMTIYKCVFYLANGLFQ
jgi:hypothetical protein